LPLKNIEIKACCSQPDHIRSILENHQADFKGTDHQIDTYFRVDKGRLKLREGTIEKNLIYYQRNDIKGAKKSDINLAPFDETSKIKQLLSNALGVEVVVEKHREIYFIDDVKFHIDKVKKLGHFMEIEAIDEDGSIKEKKLRGQCSYYMHQFDITKKDLVAESYADLIQC
jgi:predicted adenylyl cyclase CyaB